MMRFFPLLLILVISCSPLKKYPLKSDRWENDIKFLESKDREEACVEDCILFVGSSSIRLWKEIESDMSPYKVVKRGYGGAHFYDLIHYTKRLVKNHKPRAIAVFVANDITGKNNNSWYGDLKPKEVLQLFLNFLPKRLNLFMEIYQSLQLKQHQPLIVGQFGIKSQKLMTLIKNYTAKKENLNYIITRLDF